MFCEIDASVELTVVGAVWSAATIDWLVDTLPYDKLLI